MKNNVKSLGLINLYSKIFILSLLVIFVSSCENNDMMVSENTFENELKNASPKKGPDPIAKMAEEAGFSELLQALSYVDSKMETNLIQMFSYGEDQNTVFAPSNNAFEALYNSIGVDKISDIPAELVLDILLYHVTEGRRASNSIVPPKNIRRVKTLHAETFTVMTNGNITAIGNEATIVKPDMSASNGIIHEIDAVLLPFKYSYIIHQTRLKIGRALLEVQAPNVDDILNYYSEDIEYHDPIVDIYNKEDMTSFLYKLIIGASPNLVTIVEDETLIDDIYAATWIMSGTFLGSAYQAKGISIFKFITNSCKVYYQRDYYSEGDIMATIPGLDQAIMGFRTYYKCAVDPTFNCPFVSNSSDLPNISSSLKSQISNEQLEVGRQLVEINAGNWTNVLPYLASNYNYHDPIVDIVGPSTMAEFLSRLFMGSSNLYTTVEDETITDDIYMATWTMSGQFNGAPFSAPGMSIVKFIEGTTQTYYSRDYYTEGDVMLGVPELRDAVLGFRYYYRSAVDPNFVSQ